MRGGVNFAIPINFEDGVQWLARFRQYQQNYDPPQSISNLIVLNHVATLRFLASIDIPVPKVYDYGVVGNGNEVGREFILLEFLKGDKPVWFGGATLEQKLRFLRHLAKIYVKLFNHPFPQIGSLFDPSGGGCLGGVLGRNEKLSEVDSEGVPLLGGPYSTARDYWKHISERILSWIQKREAFPLDCIDAYLFYRSLFDLSDSLSGQEEDRGPFYLRHPDDLMQQFLVDEEYNIVGIIDWDWCVKCIFLAVFCTCSDSYEQHADLAGFASILGA